MGTIPCPGRRSAAFLPGNDTGGTSPGTLPSKDSPLGTVFSGKLRAVPMIIIQHLKKIGAVKVLLRVTNSKSNDTIGF